MERYKDLVMSAGSGIKDCSRMQFNHKLGGGKVGSGTESAKVGGGDNGIIRLGLKCGGTWELEISEGLEILFWREGWPSHKVGVKMMRQGRKVVLRLGADTQTL